MSPMANRNPTGLRDGAPVIEITRDERAVLFEMVRSELEPDGGLGSVKYAPEIEQFGGDYRQRRELHNTLLRLYDCIGWHEADGAGRERFGITIEPQRLVRLLDYLAEQ